MTHPIFDKDLWLWQIWITNIQKTIEGNNKPIFVDVFLTREEAENFIKKHNERFGFNLDNVSVGHPNKEIKMKRFKKLKVQRFKF